MSSLGSMAPATVFVDADNTLWDTDHVFADAQLSLLGDVETATATTCSATDRLGYIRALDQAIAARHHGGLRYPPKLLIRAAALALSGTGTFEAARASRLGSRPPLLSEAQEAEIEQSYFSALRAVPDLRPGVMSGMLSLQQAGSAVLIVSEAARAKVERIAAAVGLDGHFTRVIEGQKRSQLYKRILRLSRLPERAFMIGDQLDRDIAPAKEAGLVTIYFPGGFQPSWAPDEAAVQPDFKVSDFAQAAQIVLNGEP